MKSQKELICPICGEIYYGFDVCALPERDTPTTREVRDEKTGEWKRENIIVHELARKGYTVTPRQQLSGHLHDRHVLSGVKYQKIMSLALKGEKLK